MHLFSVKHKIKMFPTGSQLYLPLRFNLHLSHPKCTVQMKFDRGFPTYAIQVPPGFLRFTLAYVTAPAETIDAITFNAQYNGI